MKRVFSVSDVGICSEITTLFGPFIDLWEAMANAEDEETKRIDTLARLGDPHIMSPEHVQIESCRLPDNGHDALLAVAEVDDIGDQCFAPTVAIDLETESILMACTDDIGDEFIELAICPTQLIGST